MSKMVLRENPKNHFFKNRRFKNYSINAVINAVIVFYDIMETWEGEN